MLLTPLIALSLTTSSFTPAMTRIPSIMELIDPRPATVNLSAIRSLRCENGEGSWVGTGFLIGDRILATANHVASDGVCTDVESGSKLMVYKRDVKHDLALMTGPTLPTDVPYIKVSCSRFKTGFPYMSYGITFWGQSRPIFRMNTIYATKDYTPEWFKVEDHPSAGMRIMMDHIAPGMSGGPVVDLQGEAHALNNAGNTGRSLLYEFADGILCK